MCSSSVLRFFPIWLFNDDARRKLWKSLLLLLLLKFTLERANIWFPAAMEESNCCRLLTRCKKSTPRNHSCVFIIHTSSLLMYGWFWRTWCMSGSEIKEIPPLHQNLTIHSSLYGVGGVGFYLLALVESSLEVLLMLALLSRFFLQGVSLCLVWLEEGGDEEELVLARESSSDIPL